MGANCCSEAETKQEKLAYQQHQDVHSLLRDMQQYKDSTEGYHDVKKMRKSLHQRNETRTKIERFQERMSLRPDHLHPIAILRENEGSEDYYHSASPVQNNNEDISDTSHIGGGTITNTSEIEAVDINDLDSDNFGGGITNTSEIEAADTMDSEIGGGNTDIIEDLLSSDEDHEMAQKNSNSGRRKPFNKGSNVKILCGNKNFAVLDKHDGKGPVVKWYN